MKKAVPALAALLLLLTATACGGSLSSDEKPVADKISTALAKPAASPTRSSRSSA
jgi:predicted small lipoprotein YifL